VFVHEYGHYIVGRICGIQAEVFSIGFGKPLLRWIDRRGTCWQIAAVPLGGYVRFVGDMDPASAGRMSDDDLSPEEQRAAFHNASVARRTATVAAGPVANFLLSIVIFAGLMMSVGKASNEPVVGAVSSEASAEIGLMAGDRVLSVAGSPVVAFGEIINKLAPTNGAPTPVRVMRDGHERDVTVSFHLPAQIVEVIPGMPAARAGMQAGDVIVSIDGEPVGSYRELQIMTAKKPIGAEIDVVVLRGETPLSFRFVPEPQERQHPESDEVIKLPTMGVRGSLFAGIEPERLPLPVGDALVGGVDQTWRIITGTLIYVGDMLFRGADTSQLGGPIRIAEVSGDAAEQGFSSLIWLIAVISTSIGLINLFPIPVLDGGHLMFYALEILRGRPVGETWMKIGTMIGLSLVILLMVFATYNDLVRL
jgi:regulator of sigma E protease